MKTKHSKIRIINVFGRMDKGGAETIALQVLKRINKSTFQYDFLTLKKGPGYFDEEIKALNSKIYYINHSNNFLKFYKNFKKLFEQSEPYTIIHSCVHHYSGIILFMAYNLGIPVRIAHSHSALPPLQGIKKYVKIPYYYITKWLIKRYATAGLAVSKNAAESLFGKDWNRNPKFKVIYTGIDLTPYQNRKDRNLKSELNIPKDSIVIGHVGSFREAKNHEFLIKFFQKLYLKDPRFHLILCGIGPLKSKMEQITHRLKIQKNVHFLGLRDDIPNLMMNVMDIFVLPSRYEGFPLVGIEAQAAGLPSFFSDHVTREVNIVDNLVRFLPIDKGVDVWVNLILDLVNKHNLTKDVNAYKQIVNTEFDINVGFRNLMNFYERAYENSIRS